MKTLYAWTAAIAVVFSFGVADAYFDRDLEMVKAQDAAMVVHSKRIAAAYALCKSENATPVWRTTTEVECLTTKGNRASRQVVAEVAQ